MAKEKTGHSKVVMFFIALGIAVLVFLLYDFGVFKNMEFLTLDHRFYINSITPRIFEKSNLIGNNIEDVYSAEPISYADKKESKVVLIDVPASGSDISICLPSEICADLIKILSQAGARMIMINSVLSDPLFDPGYADLGNVIKSSRGVYLPILYELDRDKPEFLYAGEGVSGVLQPKPFLYGDNAVLGHINAFPDSDKKLRRVPAIVRYKSKENYHLGLGMAFNAIGVSSANVKFDPESHVITLKLPSGAKSVIPLEHDNQLMINWGSAEKSPIPHFRYRDIVESYELEANGLPPIIRLNTFYGKICIIGTAESNVITGKPVKIENDYTTSGACATIIDSILKTSLVRHMPKVFNALIIFFISLITANALLNRNLLNVMMIMVIFTVSLMSLYVYGMLNAISLVIAVGSSIGIGILLASFSLFSGFIFTILSILAYFIISAGIFKLTNLDIVTFYPMLAILMIFVLFDIYTILLGRIQSLQMFNMASRDGLTGLFNRRQLNIILDSEIARTKTRKGSKLSIVMCDIDNFKKLNDTYGHQAGDAILKELAKVLSSKCRKSDIVARYGGEEFMVVLAAAGSEDAYNVAELMRKAVEAKTFTFKGEAYNATLSMGLVEVTKENTKEELIEKADQALYKAKKEGKNRVVIY